MKVNALAANCKWKLWSTYFLMSGNQEKMGFVSSVVYGIQISSLSHEGILGGDFVHQHH